MAQQTMLNGNRYSFVNITVNIGGNDQPRVFKSINYKATQEPGTVQANQVTVVGLTAGYGVGSGSFEMLISELDDLYASLTNNGEVPIMAVDFDMIVAYSVNDVDVRTDSLLGCRITDLDASNQQGTDASTRANTLFIRRVLINGIDAYADPANA